MKIGPQVREKKFLKVFFFTTNGFGSSFSCDQDLISPTQGGST